MNNILFIFQFWNLTCLFTKAGENKKEKLSSLLIKNQIKV